MSDVTSGEKTCWFVMRDLGRTSLDKSYYKLFKDNGFEAYTPLKWQLAVKNGKRSRVQVPVIRDLLFVHDVRSRIEAFIQKYSAIQFRYVRGAYCCPMVVPEADMNRFIRVTDSTDSPEYYTPCDITPNMCGRRIRIIGGPLDGCEGKLVTVRGSKRRRIMVSLLNLLSVAVEGKPEYIQFIED